MTDHPRTSAELRARTTMARAVVADFRAEADAYLNDGASAPDFAAWAYRLCTALDGLLSELARTPGPGPVFPGSGTAHPGGGWISGASQGAR